MNDIFSLISFILSLFIIGWNIINYFLTKNPIIDFIIEEIKPYYIRFYLKNIGDIKGILKDVRIFNSISNDTVLLEDIREKILIPNSRTDNFYLDLRNEKNLPKNYRISINVIIIRKTLFFSKKYPLSRNEVFFPSWNNFILNFLLP